MARPRPQNRTAYTLLEMVLATASAGVLMTGLASSLYIATQTLDIDSGAASDQVALRRAVDQLTADLRLANAFGERTSTTIKFTVPDRNGDGVAEVLRYALSGTDGDQLTLEMNGGEPVVIVDGVSELSFTYLDRLMQAPVVDGDPSTQTVLFVSSSSAALANDGSTAPTSSEQLRVNLISGWEYQVDVISQSASAAQFEAKLADAQAVYVSGDVTPSTISSDLDDSPLGIITESFDHAVQMDLYDGSSGTTMDRDSIDVVTSSSYITQEFGSGELKVFSTDQELKSASSSLAPGTKVLANLADVYPDPTLVAIDAGAELAGGDAAPGRRVQLPWGEGGFDPTTLNDNGQLLMRRAIEWAVGAADPEQTGVAYHEFDEYKLNSNSDEIEVPVPSGAVEGDLLIAVVATDGDEGSDLSAPSGWSTINVLEGDGRVTLGVWYKLASSSEPGSYVFQWSSSERAYGWIMRFSGHDPSSPLNAVATASGKSDVPESPSVPTSVANCMILRIGGFDDDDVGIDDAGISGHATITMDESGTSSSASGGAAYLNQADPGNSGTSAFTLTASEEFATVTIAIAPEVDE